MIPDQFAFYDLKRGEMIYRKSYSKKLGKVDGILLKRTFMDLRKGEITQWASEPPILENVETVAVWFAFTMLYVLVRPEPTQYELVKYVRTWDTFVMASGMIISEKLPNVRPLSVHIPAYGYE